MCFTTIFTIPEICDNSQPEITSDIFRWDCCFTMCSDKNLSQWNARHPTCHLSYVFEWSPVGCILALLEGMLRNILKLWKLLGLKILLLKLLRYDISSFMQSHIRYLTLWLVTKVISRCYHYASSCYFIQQDNAVNLADFFVASRHVREIVVPDSYVSKSGARNKARALQVHSGIECRFLQWLLKCNTINITTGRYHFAICLCTLLFCSIAWRRASANWRTMIM